MKSFVKGVSDISQSVVKTFKKACDVAVDPNHTQADIDQVWRDFEKACEEAGNTTDAVHGEVKEHVTQHMRDGGMSEVEAEKWFEQKWKDVKDLGDKIRQASPKVEATGKLFWLKILGLAGATAAGGWVLTAITGAHRPETESDRMYQFFRREAAETAQMQRLLVSEEEFNIMIGGLAVQSAPLPDATHIAAAAAPEPMPAAIAAEANEPAEVEVITPSGTLNVTSTIGRVYQNAPGPVRREMEQEPLKIDHGYDHQKPNLGGHHKEFTVATDFAAAHVKY